MSERGDRWLDQQTAGDGPNDYADRCDCCGSLTECGCEIALETHQEEVIRDEQGVVTRSVDVVVCRTHRCEVEAARSRPDGEGRKT